jgi:hypothetical protein
MATEPSRHPLDEEIEAVYAANPGLRERLNEMEDQLDRGELDLVDDEEIRQRVRKLQERLGEPLIDDGV